MLDLFVKNLKNQPAAKVNCWCLLSNYPLNPVRHVLHGDRLNKNQPTVAIFTILVTY